MRPAVAIMLVAAMAACSVVATDPYPLPSGPPPAAANVPATVGAETPTVVLFITPRPGDQIELLSAEPIGVAAGADVRFFFSPPVLKLNGDRVVGEDLQELAGATFSNPTTTDSPDSVVGMVAEITAREPGRFTLTAVRLRYRLNGGPERVGEGIDVVFTVCADDPAPKSCEE